MKNQVKKTGIAALIMFAVQVGIAQPENRAPQPLAAQPMPPPPGHPGKHLHASGVTTLSTVSGKILAFTTNDRYEYDGFTLQTTDRTLTVKFPLHMGEQIMQAAPKGSAVTLNGTMDLTPEGERFQVYDLKAGNKTLIDSPPADTGALPADVQKDFSGRITELNHDARGTINGFIVDGKMLVELPPPAVEQLFSVLKTGTSLSGTVIQHAKRQGVATAQNMELARARTLTIAGQTYLVR